MLVLALDTATRTGSVALARDGEVVAHAAGDGSRLHAEHLPGWLLTTLADAAHTLAEVDRFAVLSGPGGFTGLRVGLATIQGLAFALRRPVVVHSTLEVLAWGAHLADTTAWAGAWMRGMRGEIFSAVYRPAEAEAREAAGPTSLVPVVPPMVDDPTPAAARWREAVPAGTPIVVAGDGWEGSGDILRAALPGQDLRWVDVGPSATLLAQLASQPGATLVDPHAVRPTYIRQPDAVLARVRETGAVAHDA